MRKRISMVLLDDTPSAREGVVALLRAQPELHVSACPPDTAAALQMVQEAKPDLVLLNLPREGDDRLTLAGALHREAPDSRMIVMGLEPLQTDVAGFIRAGVSGFIMADASFDTFLSTIHSVVQGIQVLPFELTGSLFGQLKGPRVRGRRKRSQPV
jgi:DNA-binding NarL/FixJ family response regulator